MRFLAFALSLLILDAEAQSAAIQQGADPAGSTPEEFGGHIRAETAKWAKLVQATGAKGD